MAILNDKAREQLTAVLAGMKDIVNVMYFTQDLECGVCSDTHLFLDEFCSLSDKLRLSVFDFVAEKEKAAYYKVERIPAIVLLDRNGNDTRIRFYGVPAGYEINSFVAALLEVSGARQALPAELTARIKKINKPVHIEVFISVTCPYCPDAVLIAHRLALENEHIVADMVDASIFTPLAIKYNVVGVPKTIINGTVEFTGVQTFDVLLDAIEKL